MGENTGGTPEWSDADLKRWPGLMGKPLPRPNWAQRFLENMNRAAETGESDDPTWSDDGD